MRSEPACLGKISLDFAEIYLGEMKIFHMNTRKWVSPARWYRVFFNQLCFVFQMLMKQYKNICSTSLLIVKIT